jgi:outer membrane protein assembly factor BamC
LDANPGQVWTLVRDYWAQLQVVLEYENPSSGIMETSWLEVDSNVETRHKYRVTIEPGLHSGYSEIYIIHLQSPRSEPIPTLITWPEVSSEKDGEQQIITSLSQYLADRNDVYQASSASLLAGSIEAARKANIVADGQGGQVLELRLSYSRAWVLVRSSIEDAGITILDNDRDLAFINVRFAGIDEETEEPGFFARLFRRGKRDAEMQEQDFTVRLIEDGDQVKIIAEALETDSDLTELSVELLQLINDNLT